MNDLGGNNYWETGVANPHLLLQDMVAIFHPELLPDHEFTFFRPITGE
jgi:iron complex transport system substrate-binding protein